VPAELLQYAQYAQYAGIAFCLLVAGLVGVSSGLGGGRPPRPYRPQLPGWIARRRARKGIRHPAGKIAVGYRSMMSRTMMRLDELRLGVIALGAPGSGKTTLLRLLVQAAAAAGWACVLVDPKGSRTLRQTVEALGGVVFTIGGSVIFNPLEEDPEVMAEQLLSSEPVDPNSPRVFRGGAFLAIQQIGQALRLRHEPPDVRRVVSLLRTGAWNKLAKDTLGTEYRPLGKAEMDGAQSFAANLTALMSGAAGRSLGSGPGTLNLRTAVDEKRIVLFSFDLKYPESSQRIGGWVLRSLLSLLTDRLDTPDAPPCVVALDEAYLLGPAGRWAVDLMGVGRESRTPVVLAGLSPADLDSLGRHLMERATTNAACTIIFRQGPLSSATASRMLGVREAVHHTQSSNGHRSERWASATGLATAAVGEQMNVPPSVLEGLPIGTAWLRVPPVTEGATRVRVECVRIAWPQEAVVPTVAPSGAPVVAPVVPAALPLEEAARGPLPGAPDDLVVQRILARVKTLRGEPSGSHGCRLWQPGLEEPPRLVDSKGYPRLKVQGKEYRPARLLYEEEHGELGTATIDHVRAPRGKCSGNHLCLEVEHMEALTDEDNTRRRQEWARRQRGEQLGDDDAA